MKVLFFSHQAEFIYGGEVVSLEFMRELRANGVEVHFASPAGPYHERAKEAGHHCHLVNSVQFSRQLTQLPSLGKSLARTRHDLKSIVGHAGIDLLHATSLKAMAYAWSGAGAVPTLWHHHDILPAGFANSLWLRGLASRAVSILAPSEATREALLKAGVSATKVKVLRNGFRVAEWKIRPPGHGPLFRIGMVGEISRRKGSDRLVELMHEFAGDKTIQVLVIGAGLSEPEFAAALEAKLASKQVRFLGRRTRMKELYQELDVLFVPSRQDPLPTVIVEAGLSGVPVVGARNGGIPEMIEDGVNGYLFDSESDAAEKIRSIRADWNHFSQSARSFAETHYDIGKLTAELLIHYEKALHGV